LEVTPFKRGGDIYESSPSQFSEYPRVYCSVNLSLQQKRRPAILELKNRTTFKETRMKERPHKYEVELSEDQRFALQQLLSRGNAPARQQTHARILLKIDRNAPGPRWTDEQVAEAFEMSRYTVIRIRERFVTNGLDDALTHRHHTQTRARALDGEQEAHLIALSCSPAPAGQARWTLRLLADRMVELEYVEQVSHETVRKVLKKTNSSHG
jgi:transposase